MAAERAIAGSAAVAAMLPRPDLITCSLERREAVLSSQIEGTLTDLAQLLEYEATGSAEGLADDAAVTLGYYVRALDLGLEAVRRTAQRRIRYARHEIRSHARISSARPARTGPHGAATQWVNYVDSYVKLS